MVNEMIFEIQKEFDKHELSFMQIACKYNIPFIDVCTIHREYINQHIADHGFVEVESYDQVRYNSRGE